MKKLYSLIFTLILINLSVIRAQDIHYSQFFNNPLSYNPALTGSFTDYARAGISYRNQWASVISNPYETIGFEGEIKLTPGSEKAGPLSAGLCINRDKAGASQFTITQALISVSYLQKISRKHFLAAGIQGGTGQHNLTQDGLTWGNQYNPATNDFDISLSPLEPNIENKFNHYNVSGGLIYKFMSPQYKATRNEGWMISAGGALSQLIIPKSSFYQNDKSSMVNRYNLHAQAFFGLPQYHMAILPVFLFSSHASLNETLAGTMVSFRTQKESTAFNLGFYYRLNDATIPYIGLEFSNLSLGLSYDASVNNFAKTVKQTNGLEINLNYLIKNKNQNALF